MTRAITATGLRKSFGDHVVLDGVDLDVAEGTIFALLGPNGAGKTTIVQILSTLISADGGELKRLVPGGHVRLEFADPSGLTRPPGRWASPPATTSRSPSWFPATAASRRCRPSSTASTPSRSPWPD